MLAMLKAVGIAKVHESGLIFKRKLMVLQDISLELHEGRTVGLMGVSGSGKTTLGKILAGLERPTAGRVLYGGRNIQSLHKAEFAQFRRQVPMVFQDPEGSLNPRKSIEESIHDVLALLQIPKREWRDRSLDILETVGLSDELLCRYPGQISGGQNQRAAIGRVLLLYPRFIILDEPTSALDLSVQAQVLSLLKDLQRDRGLGYLLISHQAEVVKHMAHEVFKLEEGRLKPMS